MKSDRKRKFSQVSSKAQTEKSAVNFKRSSSSAPIISDDTPSSSLSSTRRPRMTSASSEDADIDMVEAKLSSPPPTPTRARLPKSATRATPKTDLPFSPNTMQIWDTLLDSDDENAKKAKKNQQRQIPMRLAPRSTPKSHVRQLSSHIATTSRREPKTETPKPARTVPSERPRRRLIDALAEQAPDETDGEASDDSVQLTQSQPSQRSTQAFPESTQASATSDTQPKTNQKTGQLFARPTLTPRPHAPKRTYGQNTKVLEEDDNDILLQGFDLPDLASHSLKGKRLEIRDPKTWSNTAGLGEEDDLVTGSPSTKIRDIYELRQAGANTRVADEMQDLAEQIGVPTSKPSSSRRAALLRIADEIKNRDFMRHLRDHGIDSMILKGVARETDVVSAYLILSILATILSESSSPHIIRLLQDEQIGKVFARLLRCPDSMKKIVQDRKNNLSKRSQSAVLGIHDNLRKLPIWGSAKPTSVSARSLSIKCLHLLVAQGPSLGRDSTIFPQDVIDGLFAVLEKAAEDPDYLNYPETDESVDLCNTLSVLDFYIVSVTGSEDESGSRPDQLLPILADIFGTFLRRPDSKDKALETSILKLTINLTNNNLRAPDICISKGLIPALAGSICSSFGQVLASVSQDHWTDGIIDGLVLRLGILINFSEHSVQVRQVTHDCHYENIRPIDELIRLFLENYRRTAEVGLSWINNFRQEIDANYLEGRLGREESSQRGVCVPGCAARSPVPVCACAAEIQV